MTGRVSLTFLDRSGEKSSVEYNVPTASAANVEGEIDDAQFATAGSTAALFASLSLCTPIASQLVATTVKSAQTIPGEVFAQREIAVMISYTDNVNGKVYHLSIPGPDWANLASANSDQVDTSKAKWTAFKTAFEAHVVSPDGNAVTLTGGKLVGRNR